MHFPIITVELVWASGHTIRCIITVALEITGLIHTVTILMASTRMDTILTVRTTLIGDTITIHMAMEWAE